MARRGKLLLAGLAVVAGLMALAASRGAVEEHHDRPRARADVARMPGWTRPCWRERLTDGRPLLAPCVRVRGRVVYVDREDPPSREVHALLLVRFGLVNAKFTAGRRGLAPRLLREVTIVGPMIRGGRDLREVYVRRISG